eukprot:IDg19393t1
MRDSEHRFTQPCQRKGGVAGTGRHSDAHRMATFRSLAISSKFTPLYITSEASLHPVDSIYTSCTEQRPDFDVVRATCVAHGRTPVITTACVYDGYHPQCFAASPAIALCRNNARVGGKCMYSFSHTLRFTGGDRATCSEDKSLQVARCPAFSAIFSAHCANLCTWMSACGMARL